MKRPFVKIAMAMTISLAVVLCFPKAAFLLGITGFIFMVFAIILFKMIRKKDSKVKNILYFIFIMGFTWIGFWGYYETRVAFPLSLAEKTVSISGIVEEEVGSSYGDSAVYQVRITGIEGGLSKPFTCRITTPTDLRLGTEIAGLVTFSLPQNTAYFDRQSYLAANGIFIEGVMDTEEFYILNVPKQEPLKFQIRNSFFVTLQRVLGKENAALPIAMLFGDKSGLTAAQNASFNKSGMAHLVAISASQFTIVVGMATFLLKKMGMKRKMLSVVAVFITFVYIVLIGENPAVFRAGFSIILTYLGVILERKPDALNSLGIAAVFQYLYRPYALFSASFVLSYGAVLSILLLYPRVRIWLKDKKPLWFSTKSKRRIMDSILLSLCVTIGTAPCMIFYFRRISLVSPITTLLAEPIIFLIMLGSILICLAYPFLGNSFLLFFLEKSVVLLVNLFHRTAVFFAEIPFGSIYLWGEYVILSGIVLAFFLLWRKKFPLKKYGAIFILVMAFIPVGNFFSHKNDQRLYYLHTEKSQCFMAFSNDKTVLYLKKARPGDGTRLLEVMEKQGLEKIDCLIVADDRSGTLKSAKTMIESVETDTIIAPDALSVNEANSIPLGDLEFSEANMSIVLQEESVLIDFGGFPLGVTDGTFLSDSGYLLMRTDEEFILYEGSIERGAVRPDEYGSLWMGKYGQSVYIGGN